jgi:endonuclease/exonuclease/phosphatase family metal-dependent hydrolase
LALAGLSQGCAAALNYDDPGGPVLQGDAGVPRTGITVIRAVTFNIKFALHIDEALELLSRSGPLQNADVLLLQEMDGPGSERIARALRMNHIFIPSTVHPKSNRDFGVAILSPWPLDDPRKIPLPHRHRFNKVRRAAAAATLRLPSGPVEVYSLHLEAPSGLWGKERRDQARVVAEDAARVNRPILVAGDFNGRGGAEEIAARGFTWITERLQNTMGLFAVDHMLTRGLCPADEPATGVARDDTGASDHNPVWAVLRPCVPGTVASKAPYE